MNQKIAGLLIIVWLSSCHTPDKSPDSPAGISPDGNTAPVTINYSVLATFPHDTTSFTEGFLVHNGILYESTGHAPDVAVSRSLFGTVDGRTGKIAAKAEIGNKYFGEGIVFLHGKIYQLTLDSKVGFIYDEKTFKKLGEFPIPTVQGWGMTTDGSSLIISDGTSNITYVNPETFRVVKILGVTDNNGPVGNINELELINGFLYANEWQTNFIVKIDTASGRTTGRLDLSSINSEVLNRYPDAREMNGIAYDSASKKIFITGKMWPTIYQIQFAN